MGYKWKKTSSIGKVLIERPNIVAWRGRYLKAITHYRRGNRNIVYVDDALCFFKCWRGDEILGVLKNTSSSHWLIIVHADGKNRFVTGRRLIFKA
ncbi:hypothetical protein ANTPLA_LOCUS7732 [Anthophora plagiata]